MKICKFYYFHCFFTRIKSTIHKQNKIFFLCLPSFHERVTKKCGKLQCIRFTHFSKRRKHSLPIFLGCHCHFSNCRRKIAYIQFLLSFPFEFPCKSFGCEHKFSGKIIFPFRAAATLRIYLNIPLFLQLCYNNKMAEMGNFCEVFSKQLRMNAVYWNKWNNWVRYVEVDLNFELTRKIK